MSDKGRRSDERFGRQPTNLYHEKGSVYKVWSDIDRTLTRWSREARAGKV